ncbi:MAG: 30S ribosome-binding factor RbfA [Bacteroidetes bacterium]|nr:MAG: 30S ribosome-binding factor RbfA [Bacteroidota bacterium]
MTSSRQDKISRLLQRDLSDIFQKEGLTLFKGALVSVTIVRVSADLSVAKVYVSIFSTNKDIDVFALINKNKKSIRYKLAERVKNQLRIVPELIFYVDDSLDYIENIEGLLS